MNELIKVNFESERPTLLARELYDFLSYDKSQWARWYKKNIEDDNFFVENIDYITLDIKSNGNETKDFAISIEMAKHLAMMARTEKSHEYRKYFIECEKQLKQTQQPQLPQTYLEALKSLVASEEERLRLEEEKKQLIEEKDQLQSTLDKFLSTKGLYDIGTFAKVLDIPKLGRTNIFKWFKSHKYLMSSNIPYQSYMKYFSIKEVNKNSMVFTKTLLKPEGVIYFYKKISQEFNIDKTIEQVSEELNEEE